MAHIRLSDGFAPLIAAVLVVAIAAAALSQGTVGKGAAVFERSSLECVSGDFRCSSDLLQYCRQGVWMNQEICKDGCRNNACVAGTSCTDESYRCLGDYTQVCIKGTWTNDKRCPAGCGDGRCLQGDQCRDGEYRCLNDYMQSCAYGVWFNKARCRSGCKEDACAEFIKDRTCTDKDGKDFLTQGVAYGIDYHKDYFSKMDYCASEKDLVEYSCKDGYLLKDEYLCPGKCVDGACVLSEEMRPQEVVVNKTNMTLPAPEPVITMPETKGLLARFWDWLRGIFSVQR